MLLIVDHRANTKFDQSDLVKFLQACNIGVTQPGNPAAAAETHNASCFCRPLHQEKLQINSHFQCRTDFLVTWQTDCTSSRAWLLLLACSNRCISPDLSPLACFHLLISLHQETASSCDAELLSLLLDAGLLVGCVSSALYPLLSSHMLSHQQEGGWDVEKAAAELLAAGHGPQAGSLLLAHRGTHQAQVTFNSALAVLRKWL